MCHCRSMRCNNAPHGHGVLTRRGGRAGARENHRNSARPVQSCYEPKTSLTNSLLEKKIKVNVTGAGVGGGG